MLDQAFAMGVDPGRKRVAIARTIQRVPWGQGRSAGEPMQALATGSGGVEMLAVRWAEAVLP